MYNHTRNIDRVIRSERINMVRLTLELIRKHAEHNEGEISTLEEIALHQENIEKIESLNQLCRNLKILLMQNNLIAKIENLNMLKKLEYLNLALNNIEVLENLEGLESLKKLDLTVNFIGDLRGVKCLRSNENLEQLFLTGNPCTDYPGYRKYVVATLPQLRELDMTQIERSERIVALQSYAETTGDVIRAYRKYTKLREMQIDRYRAKEGLKIIELDERGLERSPNASEMEDDEEENSKFWSEKSYHTPEDRIEIAERSRKRADRHKRSSLKENEKPKYVPKLFNSEGRPYNINQAKVSFKLNDEEDRENLILEVAAYKHLDTAHLDVDVQPFYVRVTIKGKILQLSLSCEVSIAGSNAKRNVTTGNLVITMPRLNPLVVIGIAKDRNRDQRTLKSTSIKNRRAENKVVRQQSGPIISKRELLEIGPRSRDEDDMDFSRIYKDKDTLRKEFHRDGEKIVSEDFVDDPEVPPLE